MPDAVKTLALAAGMGLVAGMRSMSAPALVSRRLTRGRRRTRGAVARRLASPRTANVLAFLAAGEMAADKTPWVPDRTEPPSLAGRMLSGALCGSVLGQARGHTPWGPALAGAAGALASTFIFYRLRTAAGRRTGVPDPLLGLTEDALALLVGSRIAAEIE